MYIYLNIYIYKKHSVPGDTLIEFNTLFLESSYVCPPLHLQARSVCINPVGIVLDFIFE